MHAIPHPSFLDLGSRTLLSLSGPDAVRYLNGQVTNDVARLPDATALPGCVTDAKGRLQSFVHVGHGPADSLWVEGPAETHEMLEQRLARYIVADDVELTDISEQWRLIHCFLRDDGPAPTWPAGTIALASRRFGIAGTDLWWPAGEEFAPETCAPLGPPCPPELAESSRIRHRIPAWGKELVPGILPPEAGLDSSAISYSKGCYIGQEVISRIRSAGKLNRRLALLDVDPAIPAAGLPGATLRHSGSSEAVGTITSADPLPCPPGVARPCLAWILRPAFDEREFHILDGAGQLHPHAAVVVPAGISP